MMTYPNGTRRTESRDYSSPPRSRSKKNREKERTRPLQKAKAQRVGHPKLSCCVKSVLYTGKTFFRGQGPLVITGYAWAEAPAF